MLTTCSKAILISVFSFVKMDNSEDHQQRRPRRSADNMGNADAGGSTSSSSSDLSTEEDPMGFIVFRNVGTRPQYQVVSRTVIREAGPNWERIYRVAYRGGRIIEGTRAFINQDLGDRISAARNALLRDATLDWERMRLLQYQFQQQQQQQQQQRQNGH